MSRFSLVSDDKRYILVLQTDGNLVLYDRQTNGALWDSKTGGTQPGRLAYQIDGNLVLYDRFARVLWNSGTNGKKSDHLIVQDGKFGLLNTVWHN